jgi:hypothetical protein
MLQVLILWDGGSIIFFMVTNISLLIKRMKGRQKVDASFVVRLPRVSPRPRLPTRLLPSLPLHSVFTPGPSLPSRRDGCDPLRHYAIHAPPSAFPRRLPQPHLARVQSNDLRPLHHRPRSINILDPPDRAVTALNSLPHRCPTFTGAAAAAIPATGGSG